MGINEKIYEDYEYNGQIGNLYITYDLVESDERFSAHGSDGSLQTYGSKYQPIGIKNIKVCFVTYSSLEIKFNLKEIEEYFGEEIDSIVMDLT